MRGDALSPSQAQLKGSILVMFLRAPLVAIFAAFIWGAIIFELNFGESITGETTKAFQCVQRVLIVTVYGAKILKRSIPY